MHTNCTAARVSRLSHSSRCNIVSLNQARANCSPLSRRCVIDKGSRAFGCAPTAPLQCFCVRQANCFAGRGTQSNPAAQSASSGSVCALCGRAVATRSRGGLPCPYGNKRIAPGATVSGGRSPFGGESGARVHRRWSRASSSDPQVAGLRIALVPSRSRSDIPSLDCESIYNECVSCWAG
jgi:hypothetical protein